LRLALILLVACLAACSWLPRVHRVTVQQGNVISQEMIDKLKPGMTRRQVAFIMGEPILRNTFEPDRWDYVYSVLVPNVGRQERHVSLYFQNDALVSFSGDYVPSSVPTPGAEDAAPPAEAASVTNDSAL
jgi:outer membrane protein assembly factor BamE